MLWSIVTLSEPFSEHGGVFVSSCALILTVLLFYHGIPLLHSLLPKPKRQPLLRKQMTPVGKFALLSQTERNPSIISFFIALASKDEGMGIEEFEELWAIVMKKHERFRCHVSQADKCFEDANKSLGEYTLELPHPKNPSQFKERINNFLTSPIDVSDQPWEVSLSSGPIGDSGAIINSKELIEQGYESETVALFRVHHAVCDGMSLSTVVKDISDEADQLNEVMIGALEKYKVHARKVGVFQRFAGFIMYYFVGSIYASSLQLWQMMTAKNPFDEFTKNEKDMDNERSVAWKYLGAIDDAKYLTQSISKQTKLNDLFVALLSSALERQYQYLKENSNVPKVSRKCPSYFNVVVPVHLTGSILPWQSIGNKIGAFVTSVPFNVQPGKKISSLSRLRRISKTLAHIKRTPAPLISWFITSLISKLGLESIAKDAIIRANCHAAAVVSNVHGFPFQIHWKGRPIKMICAFLPLPPRVPVGLLVTSYDGTIVLCVEADARVIPDAEQFLDYMLEEYNMIKSEASREGKL